MQDQINHVTSIFCLYGFLRLEESYWWLNSLVVPFKDYGLSSGRRHICYVQFDGLAPLDTFLRRGRPKHCCFVFSLCSHIRDVRTSHLLIEVVDAVLEIGLSFFGALR